MDATWKTLVLLILLMLHASETHADKRVLLIGIDGAGGSFLQAANTPHLDALGDAGGVRYDFLNEGALVPNPPDPYGASGVNWSTILTGASAASHQVQDNSFTGNNFANVPSFFHFVEYYFPALNTASIVNWTPINTHIIADEDADLELGSLSDIGVKDATVDLLSTGDPHAIFLHFDEVDHAGHSYGWGSANFRAAIETVDEQVGEIITAVNNRPGVISGSEDWLVLVTADHGGQGTSHYASQGPINWEVPAIISGPSVPDGASLSPGTLRDLATTALWHLGIDPFGTTAEGNVVGIAAPPTGPPNGINGDINQDGFVLGDGTGPASADDVTAFVQGWRTTGHATVAEAYAHGDLNLDHITDLRDWAILNQLSPAMGRAAMVAFGQIPEPQALVICGSALGALWLRRGR